MNQTFDCDEVIKITSAFFNEVADLLVYEEVNGKTRKGLLGKCDHCKSLFIGRADRPSTFCSNHCRNESRRSRTLVACASCGFEFDKPASKCTSKSGLHFCSRECKDDAQRIGGVICPSHYGTAQSREVCKNLIDQQTDPECVGCGASERFLLCVHHIDGNHDNNARNNLEIVCFNCHAMRHLKLQDESWRYDPHSLTSKEVVTMMMARYRLQQKWSQRSSNYQGFMVNGKLATDPLMDRPPPGLFPAEPEAASATKEQPKQEESESKSEKKK